MKIIAILSSAILCSVAYAQERPPEKQEQSKPAQQAKPVQGKPAQQAKPAPQQAKQPPRARPVEQAKPTPQQSKSPQQQAKPAPQPAKAAQQARPVQQQAKSARPVASHGRIPDEKFRASFGSGHTFHVSRSDFSGESRRFQYGGYSWAMVNPWPVSWLYTDNVYVDYMNGGYFLCDPVHPGVYLSINIG